MTTAHREYTPATDALREAETLIHSSKGILGGEPVFKGTRIPARAIASMRDQGASVEELLDGYPALTLRMIELAELWTAAHPAHGRPKKLSDQGLPIKSVKKITLSDRFS